MLFALPSYSLAALRHAKRAVDELARTGSPLLSQIRTEEMENVPTTFLTGEDGRELELHPLGARVSLEMPIERIVAGDLGEVLVSLEGAAAEQRTAMTELLLSSLTQITELTGNQLDAAGRPMSWDLITDALEMLEIEFDDEGKMNLSLVMSPSNVRRLEELGPPTAEQKARHEAMLERKRHEWLARQRTRRLHRG